MSDEEIVPEGTEPGTPPVNAEQTEEIKETEKPQEETAETTETTAQEVKPEKTFTQAELDRIVQRRLARERYRPPEQPAQPQAPVTREKPNPQALTPQGQPKYQTYEAYLEDLSDWKAEQKLTEFQQRNQQETFRTQMTQAAQQFDSRANDARGKYEDFDEVAFDDNLPVTQAMSQALMESEQGPEILYYLGNNPKEAMRISRLSPTAQIREIGKIEAKVTQPEVSKPKPSAAPKPITPVNTAKPKVSNVPEDSQDIKTWMAKRKEQVRGSRKS